MAFRILNFCGGGMRGLMSALILQRLDNQFQERHGKSLIHQADMIAGTSTGSVITGLLLAGISPRLIVDFYMEVMRRSFEHAQSNSNAPALPADTMIALLDKFHLDPPISFFKKKALFTSFDIGSAGVPWSPQLFNNFPGSDNAHIGLFDVIAGSCAMPGMSAPHACKVNGRPLRLVDGAFAHHDPTVPAIALAASHGNDVAAISAIDIGTGFMRNFITADVSGWGANQWLSGDGADDGALPGLLLNQPPTPAQMPILNMCLNGTSTSMMPDIAAMLLGNRFAYLNPDFGATYIPEDIVSDEGLAFLTLKAEECDLRPAMAVLDQYWAD